MYELQAVAKPFPEQHADLMVAGSTVKQLSI
jgi:hypothetical protein